MGLDQDMLKASVSNSIMAVKLIAIEIRWLTCDSVLQARLF